MLSTSKEHCRHHVTLTRVDDHIKDWNLVSVPRLNILTLPVHACCQLEKNIVVIDKSRRP